jgi:hypothetical protein
LAFFGQQRRSIVAFNVSRPSDRSDIFIQKLPLSSDRTSVRS